MKIWFLSLSLLGLRGFAEGDPTEINLRESCRQIWSGRYIAAFDRMQQAHNDLKHFESQVSRFKSAIKKGEKEFAAKDDLYRKTEYNTKAFQERSAALSKLKALRAVRDQNQKVYEEAVVIHRKEKKNQLGLKKIVETVFIIHPFPQAPKRSYPLRLDYKDECPKFRFMCRLPKERAHQLLKISSDEDSEICRKYAAYSGVNTELK